MSAVPQVRTECAGLMEDEAAPAKMCPGTEQGLEWALSGRAGSSRQREPSRTPAHKNQNSIERNENYAAEIMCMHATMDTHAESLQTTEAGRKSLYDGMAVNS